MENKLSKITEPNSLPEALSLAIVHKQWASKMDESELNTRLYELCLDVCDIIGQRSASRPVLEAGAKALKDAVTEQYKFLHIMEVEEAVKNWAKYSDDEVKHFSGAKLIRALKLYVQNDRSTVSKRIRSNEKPPKELSMEEKERVLESFYKSWSKFKNGNGVDLFAGYSPAYELALETGKIKLTQDDYWGHIQTAIPIVLENLKSLQVQRAISGTLYRLNKDAIESLTFDSIFVDNPKTKLPDILVSECRKLAIEAYFMEREMEEI